MFLVYNAKVGKNYGRKMMHGVKKAKEISVGETKIGKLLSKINSEAQTKRQNVLSFSLNPKVYSDKYFGYEIHYNQNEKLGMLGFVHVCA